ncbi:hypothetical protein [Synoicihabitans lomoniglobus]|uniref:DUF1737 domain-containing protein n=1 Tax=Synoicihabitans lomoniglobus TaxID=2909285 RepID=A0AAF0CQQ6_9BACT|nr:hypothetical protein [Opitutaceae bacterium LMO-M01]WED66246.1 hypothetical protein PXH66_05220 [Opitutaceae bacterium LMO-M01]
MDTYQIITVSFGFTQKKALDELASRVNEAMRQGWKPTGGLSTSGTLLAQAMYKSR